MPSKRNVAILGATNKTDRYSYVAFKLLVDNGYNVIPIHPVLDEIEGIPVVHSISDLTVSVDTLSIYVNPQRVESLLPRIINLHPMRVILNPGTESPVIESALETAGIHIVHACTIILLRTNQFELV